MTRAQALDYDLIVLNRLLNKATPGTPGDDGSGGESTGGTQKKPGVPTYLAVQKGRSVGQALAARRAGDNNERREELTALWQETQKSRQS